MLWTHCSSTGPVILVFNYHVNFLSVMGHDLLNESNTFALNPKPVVLWRLFEPLNPKPFSSPHATIQNYSKWGSNKACICCLPVSCVRSILLLEWERKQTRWIYHSELVEKIILKWKISSFYVDIVKKARYCIIKNRNQLEFFSF